MKHIFFVIILVICALASTLAPAQTSTTCECEQNFDAMITKLEANYIGYHLTKDAIASNYAARKQKYKAIVNVTPITECAKILQEFLQFFKDGHLFVSEYPKFPDADLQKYKLEITAKKIDPQTVQTGTSAPIEGYWTDGTSVFAIVRNTSIYAPYEFVAVIINAPDKNKIGEIKFAVRLSSSSSNALWEGVYYTNAYAPRYVSVTPYKDNTLLSIWGGVLWERLPDKNATLSKPEQPTVRRLDAQTMLLTVPSFLIDKTDFDKVLLGNVAELISAKYLVIDIRGNTGGNGIYFDLLRAYYEKPAENKRGLAVSTEDNIAYFAKFTNPLGTDPYSPVVAEMKSAKGAVVKGPAFKNLELEPMKTSIKKVVILTDRGNKSAAETFVLYSKAVSTKVLTMGENTGGVVDYNNINMVKLLCDKHGIQFGYPTYTLHDKIPQKGYNKTGIAPDVRIPAAVKDKIAFVMEYLNNNK